MVRFLTLTIFILSFSKIGKQKMPSNDDIYLYKLSTKRVLNFTTLFVLLSTILNLRGQNVDKWQFSVNFCVDKILANPYISYYLPQHCLYFFPEPHELNIPIFMLFIVFIVLFVFIVFRYQVSSVFIVFMLLSVLFVFLYCGLFVDIDHIRSLI